MDDIIYLIISVVAICLILFGWTGNLRLTKRVKSFPLGFISLISLALGFYVWFKYGLILDYGVKIDADSTFAKEMYLLGQVTMILSGLSFSVLAGRFIKKKASA